MNRVALITGAGRGIGRAIAIGLANSGHDLAITSRTKSELAEVGEIATAAGRKVLALTADLTDRTAANRMIGQIEEQLGAVDVLVNNAGIGSSQNPQPLTEFDDQFWEMSMLVNVTVPYLLTKRTLPSMIERGFGRIINISSINAKVPSLHGVAYTTSKHAIAGLTKATANEVAKHGITCNAVCPGVTATLMNDKRLEYDAQRLGKTFADLESNASPLGRRLVPDEVAALAVFLASDGACAINGQLLNVCGGTVMC